MRKTDNTGFHTRKRSSSKPKPSKTQTCTVTDPEDYDSRNKEEKRQKKGRRQGREKEKRYDTVREEQQHDKERHHEKNKTKRRSLHDHRTKKRSTGEQSPGKTEKKDREHKRSTLSTGPLELPELPLLKLSTPTRLPLERHRADKTEKRLLHTRHDTEDGAANSLIAEVVGVSNQPSAIHSDFKGNKLKTRDTEVSLAKRKMKNVLSLDCTSQKEETVNHHAQKQGAENLGLLITTNGTADSAIKANSDSKHLEGSLTVKSDARTTDSNATNTRDSTTESVFAIAPCMKANNPSIPLVADQMKDSEHQAVTCDASDEIHDDELVTCDSSRRRKLLTTQSKHHVMSISVIHTEAIDGSPNSKEGKKFLEDTNSQTEKAEANEEANRRLREFANSMSKSHMNVLIKEFQHKIRTIRPFDSQCLAHKQHEEKNRYSDIFCLDETRIVLRNTEGQPLPNGNDYIHANVVSSADLRHNYVITQAPTRESAVDFWHMVWQLQTPLVLMLCDYIENGNSKCFRYLPRRNETMHYKNIFVHSLRGLKHAQDTLIETRLRISSSTDSRPLKLRHFRWTGWPDHGVPTDFQTIFRLLKESREVDGVPIIHCSAGIGRSGTLVTIEMCLGVLRSGKSLNVKRCVELLRNQRAQCVQTVTQYLFVFRALLELAEVNGFIEHRQLKSFRASYERLTRTKTTILK